MNWLKPATILSLSDWRRHIDVCNEEEKGSHIAVVSGSLIPSAETSYPNPPFLCYGVRQREINLSGEVTTRWVHTCFTIIDASIIGAQNDEIYRAEKEKRRKELEENQDERRQTLLEDLEMDEEAEEDLGTVGLRQAMEAKKEE